MAKILGVKIDDNNFSRVLQKIRGFLESDKLNQIVTVNPEFIVSARHDPEFKKVLNEAELSVADGFGLKLGAILSGQKIAERITGVDLTWEIAKIASENNKTIFLLGGKKGIAEKTAEKLQMIYPDLKIAGTYAGTPEEEELYEKIIKSRADILLVAFGAPRQDKFIYKLKISNFEFRISNLRVAIGVGGTFDYICGVVPRAPKFMRSLGLEWLYRLVRQPSRIKRIYNAVIKFPLLVLFNRH
jgi:N-acetylglucosaminyldiphosphoundecaprenol N-acetyl-beta-D-mannosaminyltransferase